MTYWDRLIRVAEAGRACVRCGAEVHATDTEPHLCKDVAARLTAYRQQRRSYLLRLIQGRRCPRHGTILQMVCGMKRCGMCYIEEPFRPARPLPAWDGKLAPKFAGYGKKAVS